MVASMATAVASPMPNIFTIGSVDSTKLAKTTTMMRAAAVTTRPVSARPRRTAVVISPLRSQCSRNAVSRNTS